MASNFNREISELGELQDQLTKTNTVLQVIYQPFIQTGRALLTFRKDTATIYYKGRQLCNMQYRLKGELPYTPTIYNHFLPVIRSKTLSGCAEKKNYSERQYQQETQGNSTFVSILPEILDNIEKDMDDEAFQVSAFYRFSPMVSGNNSDVILLDIEAAFAEHGKKTDRIDMVLYHTKEQQLIFVEVKRLSDGRLYVKPGSTDPAEIIGQMNDYKLRLSNEKVQIKEQYNHVIDQYNRLAGKNIPLIGDKDHLLGLLVVECTKEACFKKADAFPKKEAADNSDIKVYNYGQTKNMTAGTLLNIYKAFSK